MSAEKSTYTIDRALLAQAIEKDAECILTVSAFLMFFIVIFKTKECS